jgi:hypothetical protein
VQRLSADGANRYRPEEFGIDPERERASAYVERIAS